MTAETEAERQQREADFNLRMQMDGDLGLLLCQHLWNGYIDLRLAGEEFEITGCLGVGGYDEYAVLLRRKSDGKVFEADIDVNISPVRVTE